MGWKLGLALRQFLPSPEAPVVLVLIMIVVVVETDDIDSNDREAVEEALIELARDNITRTRLARSECQDQFKIPLG